MADKKVSQEIDLGLVGIDGNVQFRVIKSTETYKQSYSDLFAYIQNNFFWVSLTEAEAKVTVFKAGVMYMITLDGTSHGSNGDVIFAICVQDGALSGHFDYVPLATALMSQVQGTFDASGFSRKTQMVEGEGVYAIKHYHPAGGDTTATGQNAAAFNELTIASGESSFAIGAGNESAGADSFAGGTYSTANGGTSFAFGNSVFAEGVGSMALGGLTSSNGEYSISTGNSTNANGKNSISHGKDSIAHFDNSRAFGNNTLSQTIELMITNTTTNSTPTPLYIDTVGLTEIDYTGLGNKLLAFEVDAVGYRPSNGDSRNIKLKGLCLIGTGIKGTTATLYNSGDAGSSAWNVAISYTSSILRVTVTGQASATINWSANVKIIELG